ncbi:MAG: HAD family hydrolase, partial [Planctomycetota bacterium]
MRPYDAVTLDMGGTLVRAGADFGAGLPPGVPPSFWAALVRHRAESVRTGREIDLRAVLAEAGADDPAAAVSRLLEREADSLAPFPDALDTLRALRARGYRLVLLSNVWGPSQPYADALERLGIGPLLDGAVFSFDVGWRKPHPAIFRAALLETGTEAARTLHVGDKLTRDVKGAKEA